MALSEYEGHDREILEAAETWATARKAGWEVPVAGRLEDLTAATTQLFGVVMAKREAIQRAMEFGPTPAEDYPVDGELDERVESLELDRDYLQVKLRHVVSFLGPAFKQWEEKCQRT